MYGKLIEESTTLRTKCPYSEIFWSAFSRIRTKYGKKRTRITPNTDTFYAVLEQLRLMMLSK